jgi:hypothetical protein
MNRHARGVHRKPRAGLLVAVAGVALLAAACSSAPANPAAPASSADAGTSPSSSATGATGTSATSSPSTSSGTSTYQKAVAYAQCMRQHGVPNFPDPLPNGGFALGPAVTGGKNGQVSPQYQAAVNACASLSPVGVLTPEQQQKALNQLLKVSACMRSHGFKNFPDPTFSSQGVELHIIGFDRNSPQFQNAWRTCLTQIGAGGNAG